MVSCILLAAGSSVRFGSPKALAKINGITVIEHLQSVLTASCAGEIIVVLGDHCENIKPHILNHKKVGLVYNKDYNLGQTSSFKAGLKAISPKSQGIMLIPVDVPALKGSTVDLLISRFIERKPTVLIPTYQGKRGHPPIFNACLKKELLDLDMSAGLNTLERRYEPDIMLFAVEDPGVLLSFNTPKEFEAVKSYLRN